MDFRRPFPYITSFYSPNLRRAVPGGEFAFSAGKVNAN